MIDDFIKKIDEIFEKAENRLDEIYKEVEKMLLKGSGREAFRYWRYEIRSLGRELRRSLEDLKIKIEDSKLSEDELIKIRDYMRKKIDLFIDRLNDLVDRLEETAEERGLPFPRIYVSFRRLPEIVATSITTTIRSLDKIIREIGEEISRVASGVYVERDTEVVSSVRIRSDDLKIIDELVNAGIFRSRSEAVSYFTRKGMECNKEWISKALEEIKKIREIQDSLKRELEK